MDVIYAIMSKNNIWTYNLVALEKEFRMRHL